MGNASAYIGEKIGGNIYEQKKSSSTSSTPFSFIDPTAPAPTELPPDNSLAGTPKTRTIATSSIPVVDRSLPGATGGAPTVDYTDIDSMTQKQLQDYIDRASIN